MPARAFGDVPPVPAVFRFPSQPWTRPAPDCACPPSGAVLDEAITVAGKEQLSYQGFLAELLLAECDDQDRRSSIRRVKAAGFPRDKWLKDFEANPNIKATTIHTLATG